MERRHRVDSFHHGRREFNGRNERFVLKHRALQRLCLLDENRRQFIRILWVVKATAGRAGNGLHEAHRLSAVRVDCHCRNGHFVGGHLLEKCIGRRLRIAVTDDDAMAGSGIHFHQALMRHREDVVKRRHVLRDCCINELHQLRVVFLRRGHRKDPLVALLEIEVEHTDFVLTAENLDGRLRDVFCPLVSLRDFARVKNERQRSLGHDLLLAHVHRHGQRVLDFAAIISARAERLPAAEHDEPCSLIINRIVNRRELQCVKSVRGRVRDNDQIIRQQRQRVPRNLVTHPYLHDALRLFQRGHERLPLAYVSARIGDDEHLALAFQIQVAHREIILLPAILALRNLNRRRVLVVAGTALRQWKSESVFSRIKIHVLLKNRLPVFRDAQLAFPRRKRVEEHSGVEGFALLHRPRQIQTLQPDLFREVEVHRNYINGDAARLQFIKNRTDAAFRFVAVRDEHHATLVPLGKHRGCKPETLCDVRTVARHTGVDRLERERLSGRELHRRIAAKHHETGFVFHRFFSDRAKDPFEGFVRDFFAHRVRDIDDVHEREMVRFSHSPRFGEHTGKQRQHCEPHRQSHLRPRPRKAAPAREVQPPHPGRSQQQPECGLPRKPHHSLHFTANHNRRDDA